MRKPHSLFNPLWYQYINACIIVLIVILSCDHNRHVFFSLRNDFIVPIPCQTLPIVFNRDLSLIQDPARVNSSKDLAGITELAQDRKSWRGLTSRIEKAAEVAQTKNWDAKRQ